MNYIETPLKDAFILEPKLFQDDRGFFSETYNFRTFSHLTACDVSFVQDNLARSKGPVVRGLHMQSGSAAQAKLISVLVGKIQDVIIDLRGDSPTYGQYFDVILDDVKRQQLFVPRGFAHGYTALSEEVLIQYKVDNYYDKAAEVGYYPYSDCIKHVWKTQEQDALLSEKDKNAMHLVLN